MYKALVALFFVLVRIAFVIVLVLASGSVVFTICGLGLPGGTAAQFQDLGVPDWRFGYGAGVEGI